MTEYEFHQYQMHYDMNKALGALIMLGIFLVVSFGFTVAKYYLTRRG
jgi:hypothetical protein